MISSRSSGSGFIGLGLTGLGLAGLRVPETSEGEMIGYSMIDDTTRMTIVIDIAIILFEVMTKLPTYEIILINE
jgi:hypothetical protein